MKEMFIKFRVGLGVLALLLTGCLSALASTEINGLYYNLDTSNKKATVTYQNTTSSNYSNLGRDVVIPEKVISGGMEYTVTKIDDKAFKNCTTLESISIPGTVTQVGNITQKRDSDYGDYLPFYNCTSLKYVRFEDSSTPISLGYDNLSSSNIKSLFNWSPLEEVYFGRPCNNVYSNFKYSPFYNKVRLKKVQIGDKVNQIPNYFFYNCSGLQFVDFGNNIETIQQGAFKGCTSLNAAILPESLTTISESAFEGCASLETVSIPGIKSIGSSAFKDNTSLKALELSSQLSTIANSAFYNTPSLLAFSFPESLVSIGVSAFYGTGVKEIKIPSSVQTIEDNCFETSKVEKVELGFGNISLGSSSFKDCKSLNTLTIGSQLSIIPESCFQGCKSLINVSLSEGLIKIQSKAFKNCTNLESISIPGTVTQVGNITQERDSDYGDYLPFYNCTSLKYVRFEDSSTPISLGYDNLSSSNIKSLFNWSPLEEVYFGRPCNNVYSNFKYSPFYNQTKLKKITIGPNVTDLPQYFFYDCTSIKTLVALRETAPSLGESVFTNYNATLYYPAGKQESYQSHATWMQFIKNYAMYSEGNLIFIPISETEAMVAKYPGTSPENINIPASVSTSIGTLTVTKVMEGAFAACPDLTLVVFPATVTEIGDNAFARNIKLASLTFNGQKKIGKDAFYGCSSITGLTLPATLEEIGDRAFYGNTALTQVAFNTGLKKLGASTFEDCTSLTAARISSTVTEIGNSSFENCIKLVYATLGSSLQSLGSRAFFNCRVLTEIDVPGTTLTVGEQAFQNCINLTLATFNEGTQTIGGNCFKGCENLLSITIPGTVTTIGEGSFDDCTSLSTAIFSAGAEDLWIPYFSDCPIKTLRIGRNLKYSYGEAGSPFRNKSSITRVSFTGNYVTMIYNNLFDGCSGITTISLPATLKSINSYAFHKCTGLSEVTVPEGVTEIGNNAFENCTSLSSVSLPTTLPVIKDYLFHNDIALASIELKEGLQIIKSHAFDNCSALGAITFPSSTTLVEDYVFESCSSLATVTFTDSQDAITLNTARSLFRDAPIETLYIGRNITYSYNVKENVPFYDRDALVKLTFSENKALTTLLPYFVYSASSLPSAVMPDNITSAGKYAFADCSLLTSITLSNALPSVEEGLLKDCSSLQALVVPTSVKKIDKYALSGCESLDNLRLSDCDEALRVEIAATKKGMCAETDLATLYVGRDIEYDANASSGYSPFYGLKALKNVTFTNNDYVTYLDDYYFYNCSAVVNLELPESLKRIGQYGLAGMTALEYCRMRNNVTEVGQYGFANDENLTDLTFSRKVATLKNNLFDSCYALPNFTVHPAVTTIEDNAFRQCQSLATLSFSNNGDDVLKMGRRNEGGSFSSMFVDCPIENLHLGRWLIYDVTEESWSPFYSQVYLDNLTLGETVGDIGKFLFEKCSKLATVNIPGVESIGQKAFYECSSLNDLTFNTGTRSLGEYAFSECVALNNVKLPATVISISDGCFMNDTNLSTAHLGNSLEIIGPSAFSGCSSLMEADIPETVYGLGVESFKDCSSLPYITIPAGISSVGARSFQNCSGAEWINLSKKVTSLGANSFAGCTSVRYIKSYNNIPPVGLPMFADNVIENATLFVPAEALEDYRDADAWFEFYTILPLGDIKFVEYLNLDIYEYTLKAEGTVKLHAEAGPDSSTDTSIGFVSDNLDVATVDGEGLVTAVAVGKANIKAFAKDGSGYYKICEITVEATPVDQIVLSNETLNLRVNRKYRLTAEIFPATSTDKSFIWSSSDLAVATVDENGEITTIYDGQCQIKATANDGSGCMAVCNLTVLAPIAGDSNDNDKVTISDAVNTANYALGKEVESFNFRAADVNGDNRITVADASGTVTIVLEQTAEYSVANGGIALRSLNTRSEADALVIDEVAVDKGGTEEFKVRLYDSMDYVALQADVIVPEGTSIERIRIGERAEGTHSIIMRRISDRIMRVILFDFENSTFANNDEALFIVTLTNNNADGGYIIIDNIFASDAGANEYELTFLGGAFNGNTTGVAYPSAGNININAQPGVINIFNAEGCEVAIYMPHGTQVARFKAATNMESFQAAPGIYLVVVGEKSVKVLVK